MPRRFDFVSPGVQLTEIDQSTVPTTLEGDGPLIIGRALKGPANKPIRVRSYNDFVAIFGEPIYGATETTPDTWRNGNTVSPQYGAIAAQAWLSSEESPITFIRLLGDEKTGVATAGKAGWSTTVNQTSNASSNGGAYGLFLLNSASNGITALPTGSLAAVWYLQSGQIELSGNMHRDISQAASGSAKLMASVGDGEYKVIIKNDDESVQSTKTFSFNKDSNNYIRNVFNTDAHKTNATTTTAADLETYFLGQTYDEMINRLVTTTGAGGQLAIILGIGSEETTPKYFQDHLFSNKASKTGWFINRDPSTNTSAYIASSMEKLFRLVALQEGTAFQNEYYVTVENLMLGTSVNPTSTFTVNVRRWSNNAIVETFSNLNMNPVSENHISKRIGDMEMIWSTTDKKFNINGEYSNQSDFIRVELADSLKYGGLTTDSQALPFGFFGPKQLLTFGICSGSVTAKEKNEFLVNQTESFALGSGSIPLREIPSGQFADLGPSMSASFVFPSLRLTTKSSKGANNTSYLHSDLFGVNQKLSSSSTLDESYRDLLRALPSGIDIHGDTASTSVEQSFVFSLDEIVYDDTTNLYYYSSGSRATGNSYSAASGTLKLLQTARVKQYNAPFFGGFDGLDIIELNPFNNASISTSEDTSYEFHTISKVLDMAADSEVTEMDLLALPGVDKSIITNRMIEIADDRQDCLALVDLEQAYTTSAETNSTESAGTAAAVISQARSRNFDSSYAAVYHPWVRVNNPGGNGTIVAVPPTVAAIGAIGKSQKLSYPWFAPAGFNRGGIGQLGGLNGPIVTSVVETLNKANRDDLYETNINPIARLQGEFVIFGQKTLQQTPSALDRINVRRLMIYVKKRIGAIADTILFDNNIQATWNRFSSKANRVLSQIQSQGGIVEYKVQLDSSTTTPDLQDRNILYAKVYIKPARAIEFIAVDFIITRSGVQF